MADGAVAAVARSECGVLLLLFYSSTASSWLVWS